MWRALTLVRTPRQLFPTPTPHPGPPAPALGTDRRRMQGNKQGVTESLEEEETGGEPEKRGGGKKRERELSGGKK